jgi:hypothetical protein
MEGFDGPVSARAESLNRVIATLEKAAVKFLNSGISGVRLHERAKPS